MECSTTWVSPTPAHPSVFSSSRAATITRARYSFDAARMRGREGTDAAAAAAAVLAKKTSCASYSNRRRGPDVAWVFRASAEPVTWLHEQDGRPGR